ncbi:helix-turn-helix domain-containing protein [Parachryseolinea silvisoli]|uniref:helix-turn-helix domain-containing protein n=1 Tax=Parachryseolinea silvisoli TaxID=2873601 RepID=UPI002265E03C|nr:helix-turn-helix transcriptional regulator [Parachryseolinea silvisoli]MCD9017508.1 helix-turn-helix domain-containing protein [Parachryseolinea silvisoli]
MSDSKETYKSKTVHHGKNLKRFREMLGLKQEAFVDRLGGDWTQRRISYLEGKEVIEPAQIEELAKALNLPAEAILEFDEEKAVYNIQNNYEGANIHSQNSQSPYYQFGGDNTTNSLDKITELVEKNDVLIAETKRLYEELLKAERDKIALLEKLLNEKSK